MERITMESITMERRIIMVIMAMMVIMVITVITVIMIIMNIMVHRRMTAR
jgi:hypothetical protein